MRVPAETADDVLVEAEKILRKEVDIKKWVRNGVAPTEVVKRGGYF